MANWHSLNRYKIALIPVILLFALAFAAFSARGYHEKLTINDRAFTYELADTSAERVQGLSGRENLEQNQVVLFVFEQPGKYGIWMKDMNFPIDIIWLNEQKQVVDLKTNVSPDSYPTVFYPESDSLYVVETNAGVAQELGLQKGDGAEF